jgi:hypothetical protein
LKARSQYFTTVFVSLLQAVYKRTTIISNWSHKLYFIMVLKWDFAFTQNVMWNSSECEW